ncbi:MAG: exopolysaccharide biosynthesis protein, partial [Rickettsiales bacterium]|nr:exopolysaccharide biosynthesis protein [Rickettsiales bacterium]
MLNSKIIVLCYAMGDSERISTTSLLNNICEENVSDDIRIGDLLNSLNEGGFALMNMLCAIILMIPTPPPIAIIMGLVIMFFS